MSPQVIFPWLRFRGGASDGRDIPEVKVEIGVFEGARCNGVVSFVQF